MADTLSDGTITITIFPEWETQDLQTVVNVSNRSIGGHEANFLWSDFNAFVIPLNYVPSSDTSRINEWWRDTTRVFLFLDVTTHVGLLTNPTEPFKNLNRPYNDLWNSVILFEAE